MRYHLEVMQYRLKVTVVDIGFRLFPIAFEEIDTLRCYDPVSGIIVRKLEGTLSKVFSIDPLDKAVFTKLGKIVLEGGVTLRPPSIREIPVKRGSGQCYPSFVQKLQNLTLRFGLTIHGRRFGDIGYYATENVRIIHYCITLGAGAHSYAIAGKTLSSCGGTGQDMRRLIAEKGQDTCQKLLPRRGHDPAEAGVAPQDDQRNTHANRFREAPMIDYDMFRVGGDAALVLAYRDQRGTIEIAEQDGPAGGLLIGRTER